MIDFKFQNVVASRAAAKQSSDLILNESHWVASPFAAARGRNDDPL